MGPTGGNEALLGAVNASYMIFIRHFPALFP